MRDTTSTWQRYVVYLVCGLINVQPVLANVVVNNGHSNTSTTVAGNGVEVVNIATPNGQGLSHNQYEVFNVDPSGLILNNSTAQLAQSELGGLLQNNPNLNGVAASTILNEVTGANQSLLQGYTEVFGQSANVILTNPYGITCNGCGFINTPRVTLSTGTPEFEQGELTGFDVTQGTVSIEGLGLDATRQTYFDIISRAAEINANIHANDLTIVTGKNDVKYQTNQVTEKVNSTDENKPTLAIDSSSLGGMYAGRIALIATEDGVGVNVGNLVSSQGNIEISADGKITLKDVNSHESLLANSTQDVSLSGQQAANHTINVEANSISVSDAIVGASKDVTLAATNAISLNKSQVVSGINKQGQTQTGATATLTASRVEVNHSDLVSHDKLNINAEQVALNENGNVIGQDVVVANTKNIANQGELAATNTLSVTGSDLVITGAGDIKASDASITATNVTLNSQIQAENLDVGAEQHIKVTDQATLSSSNNLQLKGDSIDQSGSLNANNDLSILAANVTTSGNTQANNITVTSDYIEHTGTLAALDSIQLNHQQTNLSGDVLANNQIAVNTESLTISGHVKAGESSTLNAAQNLILTGTGEVESGKNLALKAQNLTNDGVLSAGTQLDLESGSLIHSGTLNSAGNMSISSSTVALNSDIASANDLSLTTTANVTNNHQIQAGNNLTLTAQHWTNNSTLSAGEQLNMSLVGSLNNKSSAVISAYTTNIAADSVSNQGRLQALDTLNLTVASLLNRGALVSAKNSNVTATGTINNQGLFYAGNDANLFSSTLFNNSDILVNNDLKIAKNNANQRSTSVTNSSGTIESLNGDIEIYTDTLMNKRTTVEVESNYSFDKRSQFGAVFDATNTKYEPYHYIEEESGSNSDDHNNWTKVYLVITGAKKFSVQVMNESMSLKRSSSVSRLIAKGNMSIEANNLQNTASQIAANNINISANKLENKGYDFETYETYYDYELGEVIGSGYSDRTFLFDRTDVRKVKTGTSGSLNSSITASNRLTLNVANKVNNSTMKGNATSVKPTGTAQNVVNTQGVQVNVPTIDTLVTNGVSFPEFTIPENPNGLFIFSPDPEGSYLIETNPALTNMGEFLGSDYFMGQVGFNPEQNIKFLGDAFYDTRIITQAIFEQTGQQYLNASVGSSLEQMQQLMDAAAKQKQDLNLQAGVSLTAEQVASLNQDIIWYERIEVNGQSVLAPKLYLAQATKENLADGALIAATDIDINAGEFANTGGVSSENSLSIHSQTGLSNTGGEISSGGALKLHAEEDIVNLSGEIKGKDVLLASRTGSVINKTDVEQTTSSINGNFQTFTDIGKQAVIASTGSLNILAGQDIVNSAASTESAGDAVLSASGSIEITSVENTQAYDVSYHGGREAKSSTTNLASNLSSGGSTTLTAGSNIAIQGSHVAANDDLSLTAGGDISVVAAQNHRSDLNKGRNREEINRVTDHQSSSLTGQNVAIDSGSSIILSGSNVAATEAVNLVAKEDVNILAVNDSVYQYDETTKKKSFGRSKTIINESLKETVVGSSIQAGGNIDITAQKHASVATAGGNSDIALIGSSLDAGGSVNLTADGDITLAAQSYKEFERHETIKKGFAGLSGSHKGSVDDATLLNSSYLINSGDTHLTSGNNIGVIASEIVSDGNVNLEALDEVLIAAGDVLKQSQEWDEKTKFLSGGNLFELEKKRQGEETVTAQSSVVQSGGNLTVDAGSIKVVGSNLAAESNVELSADTGSVEILAAKETTKTFESEEKLAISMGDGFNGVSVEDGQLKVSLGEATYDKVEQQTEALNHKGSVVTAGNNLSVDAEADILVEGSALIADQDADQSGDLSLAAKDSITVKEAEDTYNLKRDEVHGKAEASLVVQHQAVEVAKAAMALKEATKKLKQAKKEYEQYKDSVDSLEQTLATLEQEYKEQKPGVLYEDVEELRDLLSDVKSDEAWYITGITLAATDVTSKSTLLVQQTAAAAQSTGTYGFNAGLHLDIEASKTGTSSQQTTSVAPSLAGQNITIKAGGKESDKATIQGSLVQAQDSLSIEANEVNILASVDTQSDKTQTESGTISASMTVYGASSGVNMNASLNRSESKSSSTTHNNSQLSGNKISITSNQDTNIKGANVDAENELNVTVGGDLNIASVQDRHSSSNKGMGISGGISMSGGGVSDGKGAAPKGFAQDVTNMGDVTGANGGFNVSNGRTSSKETVLTTLTSGGNANISVANNTDIKGALVATVDENGKDLGNLNLTTDTLTYADLTNSRYEQNQNTGINSSVGVQNGDISATSNSTSIQHSNSSGYSKGKTLATLGEGNLTINNQEDSHDLTALNRDTENTEKDLFDVDRQQGNIDVTLDHRLLSEEGRNQIGKEMDEFGNNIQKTAQNVPAAEGGNVVENAIGELLNKLSFYTGGILPSDETNGGIVAQIPVLLGDTDVQNKVLQVGTADMLNKDQLDNYIPIEESDFYIKASEETQSKLKGMNLLISKTPVKVTEGTSTFQNGTNGMMNSEGDAIKNVLSQTHNYDEDSAGYGSVLLNVNYNPTHGFLGDGIESAVDKMGGTTGMAKQTGEFIRDTTTAQGSDGSNFANHSQGNLLNKSGLEYITSKGSYEQGGFKDPDYFDNGLNDKGIPTFAGYGSPVNTEDMKQVVEDTKFDFKGNFTNEGDFVGEVLGKNVGDDGNRGNTVLTTIKDAVNMDTYINASELFSDESPHSNYNCGDLSTAVCGAKQP